MKKIANSDASAQPLPTSAGNAKWGGNQVGSSKAFTISLRSLRFKKIVVCEFDSYKT